MPRAFLPGGEGAVGPHLRPLRLRKVVSSAVRLVKVKRTDRRYISALCLQKARNVTVLGRRGKICHRFTPKANPPPPPFLKNNKK